MKKLMAFLLTLAMLAGCASALAEEDPRADLSELTARLKELLDISDDYATFQSDYAYRGDDRIWNLNWESQGKYLSLASSEQGLIYHLYRYDTEMYTATPSFAPRLASAPQDLNRAVSDFLEKVLGEGEGYQVASQTSYYPGEGYCDYSLTGYITRDGVPTETTFYLNLQGEDMAVASYERSDSYMRFTRRADTAEAVYDQQAAQTRLQGAYIVDIRYIADGKGGVRLAYVPVPRGGYVLDAVTGQVIPHNTEDAQVYTMGGGEGEADMGAMKLTPAELEGIEKLEGVRSQAELDAAVRAIPELGVTEGFTLTGSNFSAFGDTVTANLFYSQGDTEKYVALDAKDMSLRDVYTSVPWMGNIEYTPDLSQGKRTADDFLEKYFPELTDHYVFSGSDVPKDPWRPVTTFTYARQENGIRYDDNQIAVNIDTDAGLVDGLTFNWTKELEFPAPENLADPEKASESFFRLAQARLVICNFSGEDGETWEEKLCYRLETEKPISGLDAVTLEPIALEAAAGGAISYADADSAGEAANRLAELGIGFGGGRFAGSERATLRDALTLTLSAGGVVIVGAPDDQLLEYAFINGLLKRGEYNLDAEITRAAYARMLVEMSGYGRAAAVPGIYVCGFADEDQIADDDLGYVAIAKGIGVARANESGLFEPQRAATRAETLDMLYAFLTRQY